MSIHDCLIKLAAIEGKEKSNTKRNLLAGSGAVLASIGGATTAHSLANMNLTMSQARLHDLTGKRMRKAYDIMGAAGDVNLSKTHKPTLNSLAKAIEMRKRGPSMLRSLAKKPIRRSTLIGGAIGLGAGLGSAVAAEGIKSLMNRRGVNKTASSKPTAKDNRAYNANLALRSGAGAVGGWGLGGMQLKTKRARSKMAAAGALLGASIHTIVSDYVDGK